MRRGKGGAARLAVALGLLLAVGGTAAGGVTSGEGLELSVDDSWPASAPAGYFPLRVQVRNVHDERQLRIELASRYRRNAVAKVERAFTVGKDATVRFTLPVPTADRHSVFNISIYEGGVRLDALNQSVDFHEVPQGDPPPLLIVSDFAEDDRALLASVGGRWAGTGTPTVCQLLPSQMPEGWISYTRLGLIGVSARALEMMPRARREDLRKWVATGGTLFIYRATQPESNPAHLILGETPAAAPAGDERAHYFGRIRLVREDPFQWEARRWSDFLNSVLRHRATTFRYRFGLLEDRRGAIESIPGVGEVPVTGYGLIVTLFAVIIGPVNYFLLRRKKKLHLLFIITPVVAVGVTVAMAVYGILAEGLGVKGRIFSLTYLDQTRHEAVTMGKMALYAGMAPSGGLWFPMDVAAFPVSQGMGAGTVELGDGQRFRDGFIRPRTILTYVTARVAPARGRLRVRRTRRGLEVTNGLEAAVRQIYLMDESGTVFHAQDIAPGASATATARRIRRSRIHAALGVDRASGIPVLGRARLDKGMYLAELGGSPFFLTGVERVSESESRHVLYGRFAEEGDGRPSG